MSSLGGQGYFIAPRCCKDCGSAWGQIGLNEQNWHAFFGGFSALQSTMNPDQLTATYGTPLYVYDAERILKQRRYLHGVMNYPKIHILYAMKANYNPHILTLIKDDGGSLETVSYAEVLLALRLGFDKTKILYTGNAVSDEELTLVHKTGVLLNLGSLSGMRVNNVPELDRYGRLHPGSDVSLRFNPDVVAGEYASIQTGGDATKFGILLSDTPRVVEICKRWRMEVVGLHEHTGSGIQKAEEFLKGMRNLLSIAKMVDPAKLSI